MAAKCSGEWNVTTSRALNPVAALKPAWVHPKPAESWRTAWFAWLIGKPVDEAALPPLTQAFERFKRESAQGVASEVPDVPLQMQTALPLSNVQWAQIARTGSCQMEPNATTQAAERHDILNVGGFSDAVFTMVANFAAGKMDAAHWVGEIHKVSLTAQ